MLGMVFFGIFVITGLIISINSFRRGVWILGLVGIILAIFGIGGFHESYRMHEIDKLMAKPVAIAATTTTTNSIVNELPTSALTELYTCFDNELRKQHANNGTTISRDPRDKCFGWLEEMMLEYERLIQQHKSTTWWSEEVCAEAGAEFWPRISRLETFGIPMWGADEKFIRLYARYGSLMNHCYAIAVRISARRPIVMEGR